MSLIVAMFVFALSMAISPGPVNLITLSNGANHGFRKSLPFIAGAAIGFASLLLLIGLGIVQLVARFPVFLTGLTLAGAGLVFYMGYRIAVSNPKLGDGQESALKFYQGVLLQWLNPKAWIASVSGVSAFAASGSYWLLGTFTGICLVICFASVSCWAFAGDRIMVILSNELRIRVFNLMMGGGLMLVAVYLIGYHYL